ncbi:thiol peroxidase [Paraglaciecola hydrolytica]|uniref:Thiol peroxidase n=1 Tax=Paraglaciecola hydrolytica TaxID=1799789 RepID=A0A136A304_9ALTE|nr:thiol peroxidase [Paraglaciecola hydrolytica]KXI29628.1 lipid hydroperoxide peroxidase [Paraglaciecola hydrolytica]
MATVTLKGNAFQTVGELPAVGSKAPDFKLVKTDLSEVSLKDFAGSRLVLNIFPSVDTGVCATSIRTFNQKASELSNTKILCVSADLPFAAARFCGAEGIENVGTGSSFRSTFGQDYGVSFTTGPLAGLLSRSVVVIDENGVVVYVEQVAETTEEPNYASATAVL